MRESSSHSQIELFPGVIEHSPERSTSRFFLRTLTVPVEHIVVLVVVLIMIMVGSFSVGVERGRRLIAREKHARPDAPGRIAGLPRGKADAPAAATEPAAKQPVAAPEGPKAAGTAEVPAEVPPPEIRGDSVKVLAAATPEKSYTVQVASFRKEKYAKQEARGLKVKGYEIFVLPKGSYSIVCVGKFGREDQAKVFSEKLRKKYKDCLVRRL